MNWYTQLKLSYRSQDYWVLPDGTYLDADDGHATAGWRHLSENEGITIPDEYGPEDYDPFIERKWARIAADSVQLFDFATPPQAQTIADVVFNYQPHVVIDLPNGYVTIPGDQSELMIAAMTGKMTPQQINMKLQQTALR